MGLHDTRQSSDRVMDIHQVKHQIYVLQEDHIEASSWIALVASALDWGSHRCIWTVFGRQVWEECPPKNDEHFHEACLHRKHDEHFPSSGFIPTIWGD